MRPGFIRAEDAHLIRHSRFAGFGDFGDFGDVTSDKMAGQKILYHVRRAIISAQKDKMDAAMADIDTAVPLTNAIADPALKAKAVELVTKVKNALFNPQTLNSEEMKSYFKLIGDESFELEIRERKIMSNIPPAPVATPAAPAPVVMVPTVVSAPPIITEGNKATIDFNNPMVLGGIGVGVLVIFLVGKSFGKD